MMQDSLEFKISTGLKNIIGKDLITDDYIAVFELVKNSYDAQANNVIITVEDDKIIIADNGKGMTLEDLQNKWLFVAYSAKNDGSEDDYIDNSNEGNSYRDKIQERRHYAGAKGIGRFSCDKLGRFLTITTRSKEEESQTEVIKVDWTKFDENQKKLFQTIKVDHFQISSSSCCFPNSSCNGTILEITGLYNSWTRDQLKHLKHSLEKLINPFSDATNFLIEIVCRRELVEDNRKNKENGNVYLERDRINGLVKNSILEIFDLKTTQIEVRIDKYVIKTRIKDRGTLIYEIKEPNVEYSLLDDLKIDLYFINRSSKANFTRRMGIEPKNFGSVFLFKNGFRVQPYGEKGDDSWGLDYRSQQGYNRFLGTRDLFGRVDITTDDAIEFREVSSRDGGLVETNGYHQLMKAFKEKGFLRLERYVVGVLWGEGFRRKKYFGDGKFADKLVESYRHQLLNDKDSEDISVASSNLGSKLDFIQIIKSLASDENIEILDFNKDFINLVNDRIDEVEYRFISDLGTIAEKTQDPIAKSKLLEVENRYQELILAKEEAEKRAEEEEYRRITAEKRAEEEERRRVEAERRQHEEEERRRKAEVAVLKKEKERAESELAKLRAEKKAKEEAEKRKKEYEARLAAEKEVKVSQEQNKYLLATSNTSEEVKDLIHTINISSSEIKASIVKIYQLLRNEKNVNNDILEQIEALKFNSEKIDLLGRIITKADINMLKEKRAIDIPVFAEEYIQSHQKGSSVKFFVDNKIGSFKAVLNLLDIYMIFDNLISNSKKSNASQIKIEINKINSSLCVDFSDNGDGVSEKYLSNIEDIFKIGITDRSGGSGIGLYSIKKIMQNKLHGDVLFKGNGVVFPTGATFRLIFNR